METPQIQVLMNAATQSLAGLNRRGDPETRKARVDQTLARYGIFTESTVLQRTVGTSEADETGGEPRVYVSVDVRFTAPDGSFEVIRTIGDAAADAVDASIDACEAARWHAIFQCLAFDVTLDMAA